jgi:hypothetical protein
MIPTMLLAGLLVGRSWAIGLGALGWAAALLLAGTIGVSDAPFAAALGAANVAVGVVAHRAVAAVLRHLGPARPA